MARVIKSKGTTEKIASTPIVMPTSAETLASGGRVIEREVYQAQRMAQEIIEEGEKEQKKRLSDGKKQAAVTKEEAMASGAASAFEEVATDALMAFKQRAARYLDVQNDLRTLSVEIAQKVVGGPLTLSSTAIDKTVKQGIDKIRSRRRIKLQVCKEEMQRLQNTYDATIKAVQKLPDIVFEEVDDVKPGFVRVVVDVGSALCNSDKALSSLSQIISDGDKPQNAKANG